MFGVAPIANDSGIFTGPGSGFYSGAGQYSPGSLLSYTGSVSSYASPGVTAGYSLDAGGGGGTMTGGYAPGTPAAAAAGGPPGGIIASLLSSFGPFGERGPYTELKYPEMRFLKAGENPTELLSGLRQRASGGKPSSLAQALVIGLVVWALLK